MVDQLEAEGSEHFTWPVGKKSLKTLTQVKRLRLFCIEQKIDILHARSRVPAWVTFLAWRKMDKATRPHFVTTVHGLNSVSKYSQVMTYGERVICVSQTVQDYVLKNYPSTDPDKLQVIHRGVDPAAFTHGHQPDNAWGTQWQKDLPQLDGKFVFAITGRLTRLKGHHDGMDALKQLLQWHQEGKLSREPHLLIVGGEDPNRQSYAAGLRQRIKDEQLESHVSFTGHRTDIHDVLASLDANLSLSTKPETFGRAVLESVRLGVPTIGYNHGGVGEVLGTVYTEGLTPLSDINALAEKLAEAANGKLPQPRPGNDFLLSDMLSQTLDLYQALAANQS